MKSRISMIVAGLLVAGMAMAQQAEIDRYNVEWDTPSENSAGSMPLGNGELGANLWVVYFDSRFRNGQGKIHITPTQSVETYWYGVENDMPSVAGLHYVLGALEKLPSHLLPEPDRQYYLQQKKDLPGLPQKRIAQGDVFLPAEVFLELRTNVENPELYAVFPFGLANFSNELCQTGIRTFRYRNFDSWYGWGQDGQEAAILGLVDEAAEMLRKKVGNTNPNHRFLAMWGPNYDWVPDQDHGSNLMLTLAEYGFAEL